MNETEFRQAQLKLQEKLAWPRAEVDLRLGQALDPEYWRRFSPDLSIEASVGSGLPESAPLTAREVEQHAEKFRREGYFQTGPVIDPVVIGQMRALVERLREAGWPPVFSYVYDEFWAVVRTPSLRKLVSRFLGDGYKQNSAIWTYYVAPVKGASGWPPHTDSKDRNSRLTVWVPLAEATLDNGCMYVIPSDRIPMGLPAHYDDMETVTRAQLGQLLRAVRALPSLPGAFMGWHHELIHWGSPASGQTAPRISIGVEFIAPGAAPRAVEAPLFDVLQYPSFTERIRAIGKGIHQYAKFEPLMGRYLELSALITEETRE